MAVMQTVGRVHALPAAATVIENEHEYIVTLDVPDFALSELTVELDDDEVTVVGEQGGPSGDAFRLRERLEESFRLPGDADSEWLSALFEHGTLELHAPKLASCSTGRRTIEIVRKRHGLINADATPC
jgi:HSP20 family protein